MKFLLQGGSNLPPDTVLPARAQLSFKRAGRIVVKIGLLSLVLAAVGVVIPVAAQAVAQSYQLDIPRQPLDAALKDLAQQTGLQIARFSDTPGGSAFVGPLKGDMPVTDALRTLLAPSKLTYKIVNDHTIAVMSLSSAAAQTQPKDASGSSQSSSKTPDNVEQREGTKSNSFRLAQSNQGVAQSSSTVGDDLQGTSGSSENSPRLTEILVTAQKRTERLQDVPMSITVLDPIALAESGQSRLQDYFASIPGLNLTTSALAFPGMSFITIRGLSAGTQQNPTVATVIDDVPAASSTADGKGEYMTPDLDPSDLAQIEVLKGPQGTLYGADSLGGLIKYVTLDPSTQGFSGRAQIDGVDIPSGGVGYAVRGSANIPISDSFALRVSGFDRHDPGYIDDLTTRQNNFNTANVYGGHVAALWRPLDDLSVKVSALVQQTDANDSQFDSDTNGNPLFDHFGVTSLPGTQTFSAQYQIYSLAVKWKLAGLDMTSITGYVVNSIHQRAEANFFGTLFYNCQHEEMPGSCALPAGAPPGTDSVLEVENYTTHKVSQEFRIGSSVGHWVDWRIGGFYTHESEVPWSNGFYAANPETGAIQAAGYDIVRPTDSFDEYATFLDLTTHVTNRFDIGLGARESWNNEQSLYSYTGGSPVTQFIFGTSPFTTPLFKNSGSAFTYEVTPRFKISPDLTAYARVASGYRIGGSNNGLGPYNYLIPQGYAPDKTTNFELGTKGNLFAGALSFDAAIYYIDWKNFQTVVTRLLPIAGYSTPATYTVNGGNAKSEGLEFSIQAHPLQGLTLAAQGSFDDAELTQDLPAGSTAYGLKGDRLPYSMRFSGGFSINQDFPLANGWSGFAGGAANYVGSRPYEFVGAPTPGQAPAARLEFPGYTKIDVLAGASYRSIIKASLYVNNVGNKRGLLGVNPMNNSGNPTGYGASIIQPRTVGLSLSQSF